MYKLILADDEEDVREGLLSLIDWESLGYAVMETAENGKEAAELVEKHTPDVVVTDIQMPFMNVCSSPSGFANNTRQRKSLY